MRERIVAASIRLPDGSFQPGVIHGDAWQTAVDQGRHPAEYYPDEDDHFFLTSFGRHVDRETAYDIADRARFQAARTRLTRIFPACDDRGSIQQETTRLPLIVEAKGGCESLGDPSVPGTSDVAHKANLVLPRHDVVIPGSHGVAWGRLGIH